MLNLMPHDHQVHPDNMQVRRIWTNRNLLFLSSLKYSHKTVKFWSVNKWGFSGKRVKCAVDIYRRKAELQRGKTELRRPEAARLHFSSVNSAVTALSIWEARAHFTKRNFKNIFRSVPGEKKNTGLRGREKSSLMAWPLNLWAVKLSGLIYW